LDAPRPSISFAHSLIPMTPTINDTDAHCSGINFARIKSRPFVGTMNCRFICLSFLMVTGTKPCRMCNTYQISILLSPPARIDRRITDQLDGFRMGCPLVAAAILTRLAKGNRYVGEHLPHIADEQFLAQFPTEPERDANFVMTSWHAGESPED